MSTESLPSLVLYGPFGSHVSTSAKRLSEKNGLCEIDARNFVEETRRNAEETARLVVDQIQSERCRRGFALHHFPRDLPEQRHFEKELSTRFGPRHDFNKFRPIFLDVRQDEGERLRKREPNLQRDNPEYDPYHSTSKQIVARPLALGTSNWIYDRSNLVSHFMNTKRPMAQVSAHQTSDETVSDICRVATESPAEGE